MNFVEIYSLEMGLGPIRKHQVLWSPKLSKGSVSQAASVSLLIAGSDIRRGWGRPRTERVGNAETVGEGWSWLPGPPQVHPLLALVLPSEEKQPIKPPPKVGG